MKTGTIILNYCAFCTAVGLLSAGTAQAQRAFSVSVTPTNGTAVAVNWKVQSTTPIGDLQLLPQYQVERSPDLINWTPVSGMLTNPVTTRIFFTDPQGGQAFYRVDSIVEQEYAQFDNQILDNGQLQCADFFGASLFGASLQGTMLTNSSFAAADVRNADFTGADLDGADFFAVQALQTTFDSSSMEGVDASFGDFEAASLFNVDLTGADFSSATLTSADLDFATFTGMTLDANTAMDAQPMLVWQVVNQGASNAVLTAQDLSFARLSGVSFHGAKMTNTLFTESFMDNTDLRGANFTGAALNFVDVQGALMDATTVIESRTRLVWQILNQNYGAGRDLHGTNLNSTLLLGANFFGANLSNAVLAQAVCEEANFGNANMAKANCLDVDFFQAMLTNAVLTNANFNGADFTGASLRNSNTNGATFIGTTFSGTIMPNGSIRNF